ncbi:hypothetical protein MVLG_05939 [Microbotryum lychnidis-dioicae p1A1 Lamole]|uniref:Uncharacterized protein n=1 Tax=Microbotryum lychnidis-dioicae (strain p1A1 Lamole / MvSl-1064) TaxID=683840 RepID=U5HFR3_USTV1|nr:hypothetical protein MVLG_05939 [Microbotryum lychnidis-dioicae p1A1 Lamole]|eukprot:KDE03604.1 hypothetical protein MVLG_05939 [Microbotryum lychnidis-dioicae p1A1 Lamole]
MYEGTMEAPRSSMQLSHINDIISKLRAASAELDIRVVMENANSTVLNLLDFKDYTLVDTGNSSADLFSLADNDVILLGESSFGALAHLVAPPKGLTIVEGADEPNKHRDSTRRSLVLASGRIVDFVQMIIENFPEVQMKTASNEP